MKLKQYGSLIFFRLCIVVAGIIFLTTFLSKSFTFDPSNIQMYKYNEYTNTTSTSYLKSRSTHKLSRKGNYSIPLCPNGGTLVYDTYCVFPYWATSGRMKINNEDVTLCTQGTYEFLTHVLVLCDRWQGPMSVVAYCPNDESFLEIARVILTLRYCYTCIDHWVDWHIFYNKNLTKPPPNFEKQIFNLNQTLDCSLRKPLFSNLYKRTGIYPINVGRNLARLNADTSYVFAIDIELYPSSNVRSRFNAMIKENQISLFQLNHVWVLPVFEIRSNHKPPLTKSELRSMYKKKNAISFHKYRCNICHRIPNLTQWMNLSSDFENGNLSRHIPPFKVFSTVKRNKKFKLQYWEPFFIGRKTDPEFDPRLSWEGKSNKMQVAFEMCLLDYNFHILDDAFLVHSPGINMINNKKESFRTVYVKQNYAVMKDIKKTLNLKYENTSRCR